MAFTFWFETQCLRYVYFLCLTESFLTKSCQSFHFRNITDMPLLCRFLKTNENHLLCALTHIIPIIPLGGHMTTSTPCFQAPKPGSHHLPLQRPYSVLTLHHFSVQGPAFIILCLSIRMNNEYIILQGFGNDHYKSFWSNLSFNEIIAHSSTLPI